MLSLILYFLDLLMSHVAVLVWLLLLMLMLLMLALVAVVVLVGSGWYVV